MRTTKLRCKLSLQDDLIFAECLNIKDMRITRVEQVTFGVLNTNHLFPFKMRKLK